MDKVIGATGPTGATGATGETGPVGPSAAFTVAPTVTVDPDTPASVAISGTDGNYTLTFSIPQGVTGPTGATGNGLAAYGGLYSTNGTVSFTSADAVEVPMGQSMPTLNTTAAANNITVTQAGDYEISYTLVVSATTTIADLEFAVRENEQDLPATIVTDEITANAPLIFTGNIITNLDANAVVDMALTNSAGSDSVTIEEALLNVKKLNAGPTAAA